MDFQLIPENPILLVAPYSPIGSCNDPHLGGAKKIELVLKLLMKLEFPVVFINTAHNRLTYSRTNINSIQTENSKNIIEITPFTIKNRRLGKFLNIFYTKTLANILAQKKPVFIWIYNGYAFEAKLASELSSLCNCPVVLEIEDLHDARSRGLNLKPLIDSYYYNNILNIAKLVTCVNNFIFKKIQLPIQRKMLLPSIIDHRLINGFSIKIPFSQSPFRVGYFGGLSSEKGADIVLKLGACLPHGWNLVVTGTGTLSTDFSRLAKEHSDRVTFIHHASDEQLYHEMLTCDAIINPHKSIASMGNGVFPFKVFEALASGRLLLSTALPNVGLSLDKVILYFDDIESLINSLIQAKEFFINHSNDILSLREKVIELYSEQNVYAALKSRLIHLNILK